MTPERFSALTGRYSGLRVAVAGEHLAGAAAPHRDRDHLLQVVEGSLSGIAGIERIEVNISMQILKYRPDVAALRTST